MNEEMLLTCLNTDPDHTQQPALHELVRTLAKLIHRLLTLQPENIGAQKLHNDFSAALEDKFFGHEG
jgi:hypothetical protein